jgi:DNA end-binding protein Ku
MASSLIESMTVDFDPAEYHDNYREALQELVNAKVEGREVIEPEAGEVPSAPTSSLADALRASLDAAKAGASGTKSAANKAAGKTVKPADKTPPAKRGAAAKAKDEAATTPARKSRRAS